jgi:hypothetical protein
MPKRAPVKLYHNKYKKQPAKIDALVYITHLLYLETKRLNDLLEENICRFLINHNLQPSDVLYEKIQFKYDKMKRRYGRDKPPCIIFLGGPTTLCFD